MNVQQHLSIVISVAKLRLQKGSQKKPRNGYISINIKYKVWRSIQLLGQAEPSVQHSQSRQSIGAIKVLCSRKLQRVMRGYNRISAELYRSTKQSAKLNNIQKKQEKLAVVTTSRTSLKTSQIGVSIRYHYSPPSAHAWSTTSPDFPIRILLRGWSRTSRRTLWILSCINFLYCAEDAGLNIELGLQAVGKIGRCSGR